MLGAMSDRWSVFHHKHTKMAGTVWYRGIIFKPTLQKVGNNLQTQVMPNLKPSMGDSILHSVSVVAVVSELLGENHFSLNQINLARPETLAQPDRAR